MLRKSCLCTGLLVLTVILMVTPSNAATRTWTGTIGDWSDPANWGGTEPIQNDYAIISNGGTAIITQADEKCIRLNLGDSTASDKLGFVQMTGGSLQAVITVYHGRFDQTGGSFIGGFVLGDTVGTEGEYNLTGGDIQAKKGGAYEYIGLSGTGCFNHTGGKNDTTGIVLGKYASSSGQYNLSGTGELTVGGLNVGSSGTGVFKQTGGSCTVNNFFQIAPATAAAPSNIYTLDGTGTLTVKAGKIDILGEGISAGRFEWFTDNLTTPAIYVRGVLAMGFDFDVNALKNGSLFHGTTFNAPGTLEITRGSTATQSGGSPLSLGTLQAGTSSGSGNYRLTDNAQLSAMNLYVGYYGTGSFEQSGGTNTVAGQFRIGLLDYPHSEGSYGKYTLSGTGALNLTATNGTLSIENGCFEWLGGALTAYGLSVGNRGTLALGFDFNVPSLTNKSLFGGSYLYGIGATYSADTCNGNLEITNGATATHADTSVYLAGLNVGTSSGSGTYKLSGTALLQASRVEQIGSDNAGTGLFQQTGGTNTASLLFIGKTGRYELQGGTLVIKGGFRNEGILDCANSSAVISIPAGVILDLSQGSIINAQNTSLNIPAHSLLIVPPGFDPASIFRNFFNDGICHTTGTPLIIDSNKAVYGMGSIEDRVTCNGGIYINKALTGSGYINLNNGLNASGATINLGLGALTCNDTTSGISRGELLVYDQYVGKSAAGVFSHSGGTNTVSRSLYLGYAPGVGGQYDLRGTLTLKPDSVNTKEACEYVGYRGNGVFNNSAGVNLFSGSRMVLYLGYEAGSSGTYNLSNGLLEFSYAQPTLGDSYIYEYIGYNGVGTFNQSSGTHSLLAYSPAKEGIFVGFNAGSTGTYNLSGTGQFSPRTTYLGYHAGSCGNLNISDSASFSGITLYLGYNSGSQGNCSIAGGMLNLSDIYVGRSGSGTFTQSGGVTGTFFPYIPHIFLATEPDSSATVNLNGGVLAARSINKGKGTVAFNFGGGTLRLYATEMETFVPMTLTGINGNANIDGYNGTVTLSGLLSGPGGLNKLGVGTLTLRAQNSYRGDTMVQGGILRIEGGIDPLGTSLIDVKTGGKALFKTTNINSPDLDICTTGTGIFEIVDGTHVVGSITGTGTTQVDAVGHLTATSIVQNTLKIGGIGSAAATSSAFDDSALSVPEPASILLLGFAVVGFASARKRRRLDPTKK